MTYFADLGATPAELGLPQRTFEGGVQKAYVVPSFKEPRIIVDGLWNFDGTGTRPTTQRVSRAFFQSPGGAKIQNWLGIKLGQLAKNFEWATGGSWGGNPPDKWIIPIGVAGGIAFRNYKGWGVNKLLPLWVWNGKIAVAKTTHPTTNKQWGVFFRFEKDEIVITFKEMPRDWLQKIYDVIVSVISFIVKTVVDLFKFLAGAACALAKVKLNDLNNAIIQQKAYGGALPAGVSQAQIQKLRTNPDNQTAVAVGNAFVTSICGGEPPIFDPNKGSPWLLWLGAGLLVLAGGAVLIKHRKDL